MDASDFFELCQETILWQQMTGRDAYGKPAYANAPVAFSPTTSPVTGGRRVFKAVRKSAGAAAVDFVSGSEIWILATPPIGLEDRVYVQGDSAPYPAILWVESPADETGSPFYVKVTLGSATG